MHDENNALITIFFFWGVKLTVMIIPLIPSWDLHNKWEGDLEKDGVWDLPAGIDCLIFSALTRPSTLSVIKYFEVLSLNLVILFFLFFLIVIFSALGKCLLCSSLTPRMILMKSFKSLISFGYVIATINRKRVRQ